MTTAAVDRHDWPYERRWIWCRTGLVRPEDLSPCGKKIGSRDQGGAVHGKLPAPC
jgi:hypothetical protein